MKRLYFAVALLALQIVGCFWSVHAVQQDTSLILADVYAGDIETAYSKWKNAETRLGALLMHEKLEETDRLFVRLKQSDPASSDYALDLAELTSQLKYLPELEKPTLKNIL